MTARARRKGKTSSKRSNPDLLMLANPNVELARAREAFVKFHGVEPRSIKKIGRGKRALVALGDAREIVYRPTRGMRRGPAFVHTFGAGLILATDAEGRGLYLVPLEGNATRVDFAKGIIG